MLCEPPKAFSGQYMKAVRIDKVSMKISGRFIKVLIYTRPELERPTDRSSEDSTTGKAPRDASELIIFDKHDKQVDSYLNTLMYSNQVVMNVIPRKRKRKRKKCGGEGLRPLGRQYRQLLETGRRVGSQTSGRLPAVTTHTPTPPTDLCHRSLSES